MAKVLIADDEPIVLRWIADVVARAGHQPIPATDGETAWQLFQAHQPSIAILDVRMPKLAGQEVCVRIKRERPATGVLLISGVFTDPSVARESAARFKNDAYLAKPFTAEQLAQVIATLGAPSLSAGVPHRAPAPPGGMPPAGTPHRAPAPSGSAPPAGTAHRAPAPPSARPSAPAAPVPSAPASPASVPSAPGIAVGPAEPSFAREGSLERTSALALLARAHTDRAAGKIAFKKDVATKEIWVRDGKLVHATSNLDGDRIERRLATEGKLSEEQVRDVRILANALGSAEAALVQRMIVPPHEVFDAARRVALALVLDLLRWTGGRYAFEPGSPPVGSTSLELSLDELAQHGLREVYDPARVRQAFGAQLGWPAEKDLARVDAVERLKLTPAEFRLARMVDGRKTPEALAAEWAAGDPAKTERALAVLLLLREAGVLRNPQPDADSGQAAAPGSAAAGGAPTATADGPASAEVLALQKKLAELEKTDLFAALGVARTASAAEVKKAYFGMAKKYHPDTLPADATPEHRKVIDGIFAVLSRANQVLSDTKERDQYLAELEGNAPAADDVNRIIEAEVEFQKGEFFLLRKRDPAQAEVHLAAALKKNPDEPEHHVMWGWLVWNKSKNQAEAVKHIEAGLKKRPEIANAYLFLGHIHKAKGETDKAEKAYQKCLSIDPKQPDAAAELRLIQMRKGKR